MGTKPDRKAPATHDHLADMLARIPDTLAGKRDRAMLALGFAAALRRSELVALQVEDIEAAKEGMRVTIGPARRTRKGRAIRSPSRPAFGSAPSRLCRTGWPRLASPPGRCSAQSGAAGT
jgi:integrase